MGDCGPDVTDECCAVDYVKKEEYEDYDNSLNLLDLPEEIFLKICSYLEADFIPTLSLVCGRFEQILSDGSLWRCWVSRRLKYAYPALRDLKVWKSAGGVNWKDACGDIDRETRRWSGLPHSMRHKISEGGHYATVDSVLLFNNAELCVSGGRDRALALWSVPAIRACTTYTARDSARYFNAAPLMQIHDAHRGWVWDLAVDDERRAATVYSGSWDNTLKMWDLERCLFNTGTFTCKMSVLSVVAERHIVMAGLYSRFVFIFDTRASMDPISKYKLHKGPVLRLQKHNDLIASLSEDKTIAVWDQTAGKSLVSDIKCTSEGVFPVSFCWGDAAMYVGDSKGSIHLIDPEKLIHKKSYQLWQEPAEGTPCDKVIGIVQGLGSMIVASDRGRMKCLYPSDPLEQYATFDTTASVITNIEYQNGILVTGTCDSSLEFWFPGETMDDLL